MPAGQVRLGLYETASSSNVEDGFDYMEFSLMTQCVDQRDFSEYFRGNMKSLGLTPPMSMFGTFNQSLTQAIVITSALDSLGKRATVGEIIGATTGLEKLKTAAALYGSFYAGALVGSLFVAAVHSGVCGAKRADLLSFANRNNIRFKGDMPFYGRHPEIFSGPADSRLAYVAMAAKPAA